MASDGQYYWSNKKKSEIRYTNGTKFWWGENPITASHVYKHARMKSSKQVGSLASESTYYGEQEFKTPDPIPTWMCIWLFYDDNFRNENSINFYNVPFSCWTIRRWPFSISSELLSPLLPSHRIEKFNVHFSFGFGHNVYKFAFQLFNVCSNY